MYDFNDLLETVESVCVANAASDDAARENLTALSNWIAGRFDTLAYAPSDLAPTLFDGLCAYPTDQHGEHDHRDCLDGIAAPCDYCERAESFVFKGWRQACTACAAENPGDFIGAARISTGGIVHGAA